MADLFNEEQTLLEVSQDNQLAFARLFEHWHPVLASYIFCITRSKELAAEIVHDVFLKIWQKRESLAGISNFKSYLFVAARNHALNGLRNVMNECRHVEDWHEQQASDQNIMFSDQNTVGHLLDDAIDGLPPRQKEVYLLHSHERLTYMQIAEKLGIGRETVKTHLGMAVRAITKFMRDRMDVSAMFIAIISEIG